MKTRCMYCDTEVTFDPDHISQGDPEWYEDPDNEGKSYYYAACLHCIEDLFNFETYQRPVTGMTVTPA